MKSKLLWITDLHLVEPGSPWPLGIDPLRRFTAVLDELREHHADAERLVLSGDLVQSGSIESYAVLRDALEGFPVPYRLLVGNHDRRDCLRHIFPETSAAGGFIQACEDIGNVRLIYADTKAESGHHGELCPDRMAWLEEQLQGAGPRLVLIFMHHPPAAVGVPALDRIRLSDPDNAFFDLICSRWAPTQLLCGHLHHSVSGLWAGHPFAVMGSTHVQVAFDMESERLSRIQAPPGYGVVLVDNDSVAVNAVQLAN